jgi:hypothetical protein
VGEEIGLCGEHIQELYTVYLTSFQTYHIDLHPKQNKLGGLGSLRQINTCHQVPLLVSYLFYELFIVQILEEKSAVRTVVRRAADGKETVFSSQERSS